MSKRAVSKMTSKNQITVPAQVREALLLAKGDHLVFDIADDGAVTVYKSIPFDREFTAALDSQLGEWASAADEEAYRDL
jgi:antitoxin PrlF